MPFPLRRGEIKVSKELFADTLLNWLSTRLTDTGIVETSKKIGFRLKSEEDFKNITGELLTLNMWIINFACQKLLTNVDKQNECLDIFHRMVYDNFCAREEANYSEWMLSLADVYKAYSDAARMANKSAPSFELTTVINRRLCSQGNPTAFVQSGISNYVKTSVETLEGLVKQYEVK